VEVRVTGKPELALALKLKGATPYVTLLNGPNVTVCDALLTVKLRLIAGAA
jgi:hypothetical protein